MSALDDALDELRQHAARIAPWDSHNPHQCGCGGGAPLRHTGSCDGMRRGDRIARLLELVGLLDEQARDGELPREWQPHHHDPTGFCFPGCPRWRREEHGREPAHAQEAR